MKLCIYNHDGNIVGHKQIVRIERHPLGMKKGWVKLHLRYGTYIYLHYREIRQNIVCD